MNEAVKMLLISLLPSIASIVGSVSAAVVVIFKVKAKLDDASSLKRELVVMNKRLQKQIEDNEKLLEEIKTLKLEQRGIKQHGKEI